MLLVFLPLALGAAAFPLAGQGMRNIGRGRVQENFLLGSLHAETAIDSALSIMLTKRLRPRITRNPGALMRVFPIGEGSIDRALRAAELQPDIILTPEQNQQLALSLAAWAYATGKVTQRADGWYVEYWVIDLGQSGVEGPVGVRIPETLPRYELDRTADRLAEMLADSLDAMVQSGDYAQRCQEALYTNDTDDAMRRATQAIEHYARNAAAYRCRAEAHVHRNEADEARQALERAVQLSPSYDIAWSELLGVCQRMRDMGCALRARNGQWRADPTNLTLLDAAVGAWAAEGSADSAIAILDEALRVGLEPAAVHHRQEVLCTEAELWACVLDVLPALASLDTVPPDTAYFGKLIGASHELGDASAEVRWATAATQAFPEKPSFWLALGHALEKQGAADSAVRVYERAFGVDSGQVGAALAAARLRVARGTLDPYAEDLMLTLSVSSALRVEEVAVLAALMLQYSPALYQAGQWDRAVVLLERALALGLSEGNTPAASFFLGLSYYQILDRDFRAAQAEDTLSCAVANDLSAWQRRGRVLLDAGRAVSVETATGVLTGYDGYGELLAEVRAILDCPPSERGESEPRIPSRL